MTANRFCDERGLLVDGNTRLPTDPCEYYRRGVYALCGCSRMRCSNCGEWIRSRPPDENGFRYFECRCSGWEAKTNGQIDNDHDSPSDPNVPWACGGHPAPELPVELGGLTIAAHADWRQVVGKILGGVCPRPLELASGLREGPSLWLGWLYAYLAGLPSAEHLSLAIAERLNDDDPRVMGRVLFFFSRFPRASGVEKVVACAEAAIERVAVGYPIPEHFRPPTLWDVLIARLEERSKTSDPLDQRVTELVQRVFKTPLSSLSHEDIGPTSMVEYERQLQARMGRDLASPAVQRWLDDYAKSLKKDRVDVVQNALADRWVAFMHEDLRTWMATHIAEIDAAGPGRWRRVMSTLADWYKKPALGHLIVIGGIAILQSGRVTGDEFRDWMQKLEGWRNDAWVLPLQSELEKLRP